MARPSKSRTPNRHASPHHPNNTSSTPLDDDNNKNDNKEQYEDALDDVHTRFILNLPNEELESSDRIFFQLEQAYWFYDDFYCDSNEELYRFPHLKAFCQKMFSFSPLLQPLKKNFDGMWEEFNAYKRSISVFGTILLNSDCTKLVLCQNWNGKSWTFPAGKVNQGEGGMDAGARETYEETGFDPSCNLGLTRKMKDQYEVEVLANLPPATSSLENVNAAIHGKLGWRPLRTEDALVYVEDGSEKRRTCYVCRGVPEDFPFDPVARKEVGKVSWHELNDLPKKSFAVLPFVGQLRRWIRKNGDTNNVGSGSSKGEKSGKVSRRGSKDGSSRSANSTPVPKRDRSNKRGEKQEKSSKGKKTRPRSGSRGRVKEEDILTTACLANVGDEDGWTEQDMFTTNEKILGRKIDYDGNPHDFAESSVGDPHKFHVVGGEFMNSGGLGASSLPPPPESSRLQPLFRKRDDNNTPKSEKGAEGGDLEPFFSEGGQTPWGDVVKDAAVDEDDDDPADGERAPLGSNASGLALLNLLKVASSTGKKEQNHGQQGETGEFSIINSLFPQVTSDTTNELVVDDLFLTDAQITAKSQKQKTGRRSNNAKLVREKQKEENDRDFIDLKKWAQSLRGAPPTQMFGEFVFDKKPILEAMRMKVS